MKRVVKNLVVAESIDPTTVMSAVAVDSRPCATSVGGVVTASPFDPLAFNDADLLQHNDQGSKKPDGWLRSSKYSAWCESIVIRDSVCLLRQARVVDHLQNPCHLYDCLLSGLCIPHSEDQLPILMTARLTLSIGGTILRLLTKGLATGSGRLGFSRTTSLTLTHRS